MGLFDQVVSAAEGLAGQTGTGGNSVLEAVMHLANNPQTGGLPGLIQSFEQGGLGEVVKSWVSTGQNLPISADQIQSVLGNEQIRNLASKLGIDPDQASAHLAEYLPQIVDKLTPGGTVPEGEDLMAKGFDLLKGKLFG